MEQKKFYMLLGGAVSFFLILVCGGIFDLYQKQKALERKLYPPSVQPTRSENENGLSVRLGSLEKKFDTLTQKQDEMSVLGYRLDNLSDYRFAQNLDALVEKYFIEENTRPVNGGVRLSAVNHQIFSFDIPASTYREYPDLSYTFLDGYARQSYTKDTRYDEWSLLQSNTFNNIQIKAFSNSINLEKLKKENNLACPETYEKGTQVAGSVFRDHIISLFDSPNNPKGTYDYDKIDFCKYIITKKSVKEAMWRWFDDRPSLLSPKIEETSSTTPSWMGYTFDTRSFLSENQKNDDEQDPFVYPAPRLFVSIGMYSKDDPYNRSNLAFSRLIEVTWTNRFAREYDFTLEPELFQNKINTLLDTTLQSIADTTVVLPNCEYACAY